jgi:hypothetical protein
MNRSGDDTLSFCHYQERSDGAIAVEESGD